MVGLALLSVFGTPLCSRGAPDKDPQEARRSLKQEGFKTDLSDFNFLTDAATAARAAALTNLVRTRPPVLLQPCGTECAIIAWKGANFQDEEEGYQSLPPIEQELAKIRRPSTRRAAQPWQALFVSRSTPRTAARCCWSIWPHLKTSHRRWPPE